MSKWYDACDLFVYDLTDLGSQERFRRLGGWQKRQLARDFFPNKLLDLVEERRVGSNST